MNPAHGPASSASKTRPLRLSAAYFGFREFSAANYFEIAASAGLRYVELPLYQHIVKDTNYTYRSISDIEAIKESAAEAGVKLVSGVANLPISNGSLVRTGQVDEKAIAFAKACARRVIELASQLGLEVVRLAEPNVHVEQQAQAKELMRSCGRAMAELAPYADDHGVQIAVENYGITIEQTEWLLNEVAHPAVGLLYDPCNYFRAGEDPARALDRLLARIVYCHLKDTRASEARAPEELFEGSRWPPSTAVGDGDIEWPPILERLSQEYQGYCAIEYEMADDVVRGVRRSKIFIESCLRAPTS